MTAYSEIPPQSMLQDFGTIWGFPTSPDRTTWQWQPPAKVPLSIPPILPAWLRGPHEQEEEEQQHGSSLKELDILGRERREVNAFLSEYESACKNGYAQQVCIDFNRKFYKDIALGYISDSTIMWAVERIADRLVDPVDGVSSTHLERRITRFCQAVWNGLRDRELVPVAKMDFTLLQTIVARLSRLSTDGVVIQLLTEILQRISSPQCAHLQPLLRDSFVSQIQGWQEYITKVERTGRTELDVYGSRAGSIGDKYIQRFSARLAKMLDLLPVDVHTSIVAELTTYVHAVSPSRFSAAAKRLLYSWALTVSKLSSTSGTNLLASFVDVHSPANTEAGSNSAMFTELERCELLLEYWISRGWLPEELRRRFRVLMAATKEPPRTSALAVLSRTLRKQDINTRRKIEPLLKAVALNGRASREISKVHRKHEIPMSLPDILSLIARIDTQNFWREYAILRNQLLLHHKSQIFNAEELTTIATSLISNGHINPSRILSAFQIPLRDNAGMHPKSRTLTPTKQIITTKIAQLFAISTKHTQRSRLRAVWRCAVHLRVHNAPLTADISRALVQVGMIESVANGKWIGGQKYDWLYDLVRNYEGEDVVGVLDRVASTAKEDCLHREVEERRLRYGPRLLR